MHVLVTGNCHQKKCYGCLCINTSSHKPHITIATTLTWGVRGGSCGALSHASLNQHLVDKHVTLTSCVKQVNAEHWLTKVTAWTCYERQKKYTMNYVNIQVIQSYDASFIK